MLRIPAILVINAGSSSLKFALFRAGSAPNRAQRLLSGKLERISEHAAAVPYLFELIARRSDIEVIAVGHRVVHGGASFSVPTLLDQETIEALTRLSSLSPEHMPAALSLIAALRTAYAKVPHVACFDTAFHHQLPLEAATLPIPRRYATQGVRRYGFHGLSYAYLMEELDRVAGSEAAAGRVVLAHLGHGASMAAVRSGRCIDTTMALTPASGLMMSTRSGDLDPGIGAYLLRIDGMTSERFEQMVNKESGLLGVSETSGDVRDLLQREATDPRAAEALSSFCYQAKKWLGALAAALGGVDTLVFSGGIGENAAPIRARICEGLEFLGLTIDVTRNRRSAPVISAADSRVAVRVLPTDEEVYIASAVDRVLSSQTP